MLKHLRDVTLREEGHEYEHSDTNWILDTPTAHWRNMEMTPFIKDHLITDNNWTDLEKFFSREQN